MQDRLLMEIVEELVKYSEEIYLDRQSPKVVNKFYALIHKLVNCFLKHFQYPFLMIRKGMNFAIKEIVIWMVLYLIVFYGVSELTDSTLASEEVRQMRSIILTNVIIFIPIWVASFLPPSTLLSLTTDKNTVETLLRKIDGPISETVLTVFAIYRNRIEKRISKLKHLIALAWALYVYMFEKIDSTEAFNLSVQKEIFSLSFFGVFIIISIFLLLAYEKSSISIMNNVQIALIENSRRYH